MQQLLFRPHGAGVLVLALVAVAAATIVVSAVVHLYLWGKSDGYRAVPTIGPLFLVQGVAGCLLGVTILVVRRVIGTVAGAIYMALSIGGLYLSMHGGLFGYDETIDAPYVKLLLVVEFVGLVASALAVVITLASSESQPA